MWHIVSLPDFYYYCSMTETFFDNSVWGGISVICFIGGLVLWLQEKENLNDVNIYFGAEKPTNYMPVIYLFFIASAVMGIAVIINLITPIK